jgi:hypothetical protein
MICNISLCQRGYANTHSGNVRFCKKARELLLQQQQLKKLVIIIYYLDKFNYAKGTGPNSIAVGTTGEGFSPSRTFTQVHMATQPYNCCLFWNNAYLYVVNATAAIYVCNASSLPASPVALIVKSQYVSVIPEVSARSPRLHSPRWQSSSSSIPTP